MSVVGHLQTKDLLSENHPLLAMFSDDGGRFFRETEMSGLRVLNLKATVQNWEARHSKATVQGAEET